MQRADLVGTAYAGPGKTDEDLADALAAGVDRIHVESPAELRRLGALAVSAGTSARVLLRVNLPTCSRGLGSRTGTRVPAHRGRRSVRDTRYVT
ncbi:hypothetical protein ACWCXB_08145 [Streptomyces sp. NPDC001514]